MITITTSPWFKTTRAIDPNSSSSTQRPSLREMSKAALRKLAHASKTYGERLAKRLKNANS